ncbi:hypothetical protein ALC62_00098 [Cyphomyrmex costatus]|uniref:Uncharacterized protein n=1 Tax=Cyphomyrmex costatus TaxID=456900 RepID=A0A151K1R3_9HYME|nr:hypothetical protein ALC62_00098 [Cyphomyrmex costatus]
MILNIIPLFWILLLQTVSIPIKQHTTKWRATMPKQIGYVA